MKTTVSESDFRDAFRAYGRNDQFSYEALRVLFDYLEEREADTGEEYDFCATTVACEYTESMIEDIVDDYDIDVEGLDEDEIEEAVREYLERKTVICGEVLGGFVFEQF